MRAGIVRFDAEVLMRILGLQGKVRDVRVGRTRNWRGLEVALMVEGDEHLPEVGDAEDVPDVLLVFEGCLKLVSAEAQEPQLWGGW